MEQVCYNVINEYFSKTLGNLNVKRTTYQECYRPSFASLKIMEYWVRLLQIYPNARSSLFFDSFCDNSHRIKFIRTLHEHLDEFDSLKKVHVHYDQKLYSLPELIQSFMESLDHAYITPIMRSLRYSDVDERVSAIMVKMAEDFARTRICRGCGADDISIQKAFELKKSFDLSDEALELVLYLWLKDHKDMFFTVDKNRGEESDSSFNCYSRGSYQRIMEATGLNAKIINDLCGKDSPLRRFQILETRVRNADVDSRLATYQTELNLASDISDFLYGYADNERILDFKEVDGSIIPFDCLVQQNPKAQFVLDLLKNRGSAEHPLHILFYGREGTGKTELAKSLAEKMGVRLLNIGVGNEDMDDKTLLQHRIRSLLMADWECLRSGGIILMDEADQVLNLAEKGYLNILFESVKTPVIWIANDIDRVVNSTRRRFNYSLEFHNFGIYERVSVWNSVLKSQGAENLLSMEQVRSVAKEFPIMAGSITLAVQQGKLANSSAALDVIREMACSHAKLLNLPVSPHKSSQDYCYDTSLINVDNSSIDIASLRSMLRNYNETWNGDFNLLLYGPPGSGKTAFVNHLAFDILGRNLVVKRCSDLLNKFVGDTEKAIRNAFEEAERCNAILFLDEADSLLESRQSAERHWEITQVNEFICQMDSFNGLFISATNNFNVLDAAVRRRFHMKVGFDYMNSAQIGNAWQKFFGDICDCKKGGCPADILRLRNLTISDFASIRQRLHYMPKGSVNYAKVVQMLLEEVYSKDEHKGRQMGFVV